MALVSWSTYRTDVLFTEYYFHFQNQSSQQRIRGIVRRREEQLEKTIVRRERRGW